MNTKEECNTCGRFNLYKEECLLPTTSGCKYNMSGERDLWIPKNCRSCFHGITLIPTSNSDICIRDIYTEINMKCNVKECKDYSKWRSIYYRAMPEYNQ